MVLRILTSTISTWSSVIITKAFPKNFGRLREVIEISGKQFIANSFGFLVMMRCRKLDFHGIACDICGRIFVKIRKMKIHQEIKHLGMAVNQVQEAPNLFYRVAFEELVVQTYRTTAHGADALTHGAPESRLQQRIPEVLAESEIH